MSRPAPSVRRLLDAGITQLLDDTAASVPRLCLAVVEVDGAVAYAGGPWPDGTLDALADHSARRGTPGIALRELAPRDEAIGALASLGDAPPAVLDAVASAITLLLRDALDRQDLARETLERYREINLLYRASETIGASLLASDVPRLLLDETERVIPAQVALVQLGEATEPSARRVAEAKGSGEAIAAVIADATELIDRVFASGRPDIATWESAAQGTRSARSALCVPVRAGDTVLGVVVLGRSATDKPFNAGDEKLLMGLAGQAGVALERSRLHEQETRRHRLEEELAVARRIQLSLLPARLPRVEGWSFAVAYSAARHVGGDFYDFLDHALGQRRLGLVVADVTGKGIPAALMMAYSRALLRAESTLGHAPADVLARTNRLIMQDRQTRPFLTALYADVDLDSGVLAYANAGHDPPLLVGADGSCRELDAPGVILGAFDEIALEQRDVPLEPGDTVVFYTDGVTEARDAGGLFFGDERLVAAATAVRGNAQAVLDSVATAVADFTGGAEQADDLTIVVLQRDRPDGPRNGR